MPTAWKLVAVASIAALQASSYARADERPACDRFDWPVKQEQAWFASPDLPQVETGAAIDMPARGLALKLRPAAEVSPAAPPSRPARVHNPLSGVVTFEVSEPGPHVVTISADGWLDVVQGGRALVAVGHTGSKDCIGVRKSVRFDLQRGPAVIQISSASSNPMGVAIRRMD